MASYFDEIAPPSGNQSAQQFADRQDTLANDAVARDNILAEDAALDRQLIAGPGNFVDGGAAVSIASGKVRIGNGFFLAGAGLDDAAFPGLRLKQIAAEGGYIELTGSNAPPLNKSDGTYGYVSWYGDVTWADTVQDPATLYGRWPLGKVITDGSGAVSVSGTQTLDSLAGIIARLLAAEDAIANFTEINAGNLPFWGVLQKTTTDPTLIEQFVSASIAAAIAGVGSGGTSATVPPNAVRDELAINELRQQFLHLMAHDNALDLVPGFRSDSLAPGRGHFELLIDRTYTTCTIDEINNCFGDV